MKKWFFRNRFERKHYAIYDGLFYYEKGCVWIWDLKRAKVGSKKEMHHLLMHKLYQMFLRGAKLVDVNCTKACSEAEWNKKIEEK